MVRSPASFLGLPCELRWQIYDHLLSCWRYDARTDYDFSTFPAICRFRYVRKVLMYMKSCPRSPRTIHPEILRVCRQVKAEAAPFLYGQNILLFGLPSQIDDFIASIGDINLSMVRRIGLIADWNRHARAWIPRLTLLTSKMPLVVHLDITLKDVIHGTDDPEGNGVLELLRALPTLPDVHKIVLRLQCSTHWVDYLRRTMRQTEIIMELRDDYQFYPLTAADKTYKLWLSNRLRKELKAIFLAGVLGKFNEGGERTGGGRHLIYRDEFAREVMDCLLLIVTCESLDDEEGKQYFQKRRRFHRRNRRRIRAAIETYERFDRNTAHLIP